MKSPIRILQLVPSINNTSGVFNVVFNWHKHIDTAKIQFDYLYFIKESSTGREKEITKLGGKCFFLSYKNPFKFILNLMKIFKENRYAILHSHIIQLPFIIFPMAKMYGVKSIIQHAHSTQWSDKKMRSIRNYLMLHTVWPLITQRLACSTEAGKFFFKKDFIVINNGIDIEKFTYNLTRRIQKRKELDVVNNFVIGHVGHLSSEKNHIFLLQIFEEIIKRNSTAKLILVGNGPLEEKLKQTAKEKGIYDNVSFLGPRLDVPDLLQAFDVFVLPSLFEGLGIVAIEAQASGLPCVLANTLPSEALICNYKKLPLTDIQHWINGIMQYQNNFERKDTTFTITNSGFSAKDVAKKIQNFYLELEM